jgi:hypothetical protein
MPADREAARPFFDQYRSYVINYNPERTWSASIECAAAR